MAKKKWGVTFEGFDELMGKLDSLEGDLKKVTEECLEVAHEIITPKLHQAMTKHKQTGDTENQLSAFQTRESLKTRKLKVRENYNRKEKRIS